MKIEFTREWCMNMAILEGDSEIGAGTLSRDATPARQKESPTSPAPEIRIAFGRFVKLMRQKKNMTMERFSDTASIDLAELISIEQDPGYTPEPRTVYQLSRIFNVSQRALMQMSGLAKLCDQNFTQEVVRFAARSEHFEQLRPDEAAALHNFVLFLSKQK